MLKTTLDHDLALVPIKVDAVRKRRSSEAVRTLQLYSTIRLQLFSIACFCRCNMEEKNPSQIIRKKKHDYVVGLTRTEL